MRVIGPEDDHNNSRLPAFAVGQGVQRLWRPGRSARSKHDTQMTDAQDKAIAASIARQIKSSRKEVTVLFTDIEYSTYLWDIRGDVEGRLMVDKHNRLLFPVVRAYRGRVIKTIGDAIMASFKSPEDAVRAAIGIQQALDRARRKDDNFYIKVRIGIHTGMAIVEHNDVFGDVVNVAARIENEAKGDEILLSEATAANLKDKGYFLVEEGEFIFKGKREPMTVLRCEWSHAQDMLANVRFTSLLPVGPRQRRDLLIYTLASLGIIYFLYAHYLRYLIADFESFALITLNPLMLIELHPLLPVLGAALAIYAVLLASRIRRIPPFMLRLLKGGFGFALGFFGFLLPTHYLPADFASPLNEVLYQSRHEFVEVLHDAIVIEQVAPTARIVATVDRGNLLLRTGSLTHEGVLWNEVTVGQGDKGWIQETIPARFGVPEIRNTETKRFEFTARDMYALIIGGLMFLWGTLNFRIRPT